MQTRIVIYGGTDLSPELRVFVGRLTAHLLKLPDVTLLSGGFYGRKKRPDSISVDRAVLEAAERCLSPGQLEARFETWLPSAGLDRDSVVRFRRGRVSELHGTAQARRYRLIQEADALVTIVGKEHTRSLLELALALGKPALPLFFTGGDSRTMWKRNRADFLRSLRATEAAVSLLEREAPSRPELNRLAKLAARLVYEAAERRCLVLMPFGGAHDRFYDACIEPAIRESNYLPHRIDRDAYAGNIPKLFDKAVERSHATVADLTGMNPNVMYEVGRLGARRTVPLMILRREPNTKAGVSTRLPFYLLQDMVYFASDSDSGRARLAKLIRSYLRSMTRRPHHQAAQGGTIEAIAPRSGSSAAAGRKGARRWARSGRRVRD